LAEDDLTDVVALLADVDVLDDVPDGEDRFVDVLRVGVFTAEVDLWSVAVVDGTVVGDVDCAVCDGDDDGDGDALVEVGAADAVSAIVTTDTNEATVAATAINAVRTRSRPDSRPRVERCRPTGSGRVTAPVSAASRTVSPQTLRSESRRWRRAEGRGRGKGWAIGVDDSTSR
jgi:hypothetical protein